ncbi:SbcC-like subunit of palindrome specific endonucl ease [Vibrio phage D146]
MKLKLKEFEFHNVFAYGEHNKVDFSKERVTLVVGENGVGKSSIPNALEEMLYNKNSRGIKKASVKNRNATEPMVMRLTFEIGDNVYQLLKITKASAKVSLSKNGEDISGHTATQTYKVLESEIGLDFATFSKLVYQSTKSSLDFLSATDTNRKKFLIGLLGLDKYSAYEVAAKEALKSANTRLATLNGSISTINAIIAKGQRLPDLIEEVEVEEEDVDAIGAVQMLQMKNENLDKNNKAITLAKSKLQKVDVDLLDANDALANVISYDEVPDVSAEISTANTEITRIATSMASEKKLYQNFKSDAEVTVCPTCSTELDKSESAAAMEAAKGNWLELRAKHTALNEELEGLKEQQVEYTRFVKYKNELAKAEKHLETTQAIHDSTIELHKEKSEEDVESTESIREQIADLQADIAETKKRIKDQQAQNVLAVASNAKRDEITRQVNESAEKLHELEEDLDEFQDAVAELEILTKAFGPKGLVAFKIESSIKQLEVILNHYLSELTAGRFALGFELNGTKLDVVIYDNGLLVEVNSLSTGQFTNVQFATLLAIRTILSSINSVEINLLFLDEGVSFLDKHGKDRLVDLLLTEDDLNTYIVSHGYQHPLTKTMHIEAVDGVSTIREIE